MALSIQEIAQLPVEKRARAMDQRKAEILYLKNKPEKPLPLEKGKHRYTNQKARKSKATQQKTYTGKQYEYHAGMKAEFYSTRQWRELRWKVLVEQGAFCKVCGRDRSDGIKLHVDHIKPRSKFPELELTKLNLQVLCEDCNMGKGAS